MGLIQSTKAPRRSSKAPKGPMIEQFTMKGKSSEACPGWSLGFTAIAHLQLLRSRGRIAALVGVDAEAEIVSDEGEVLSRVDRGPVARVLRHCLLSASFR